MSDPSDHPTPIPRAAVRPGSGRGTPGLRLFVGTGTAMLIVGALYLARALFIPVALAVLLVFLLAPLVDRFERLKLGKVPAVIVVTMLAFVLLTAAGYGIVRQLTLLGDELPGYRSNIREKVVAVRQMARSKVFDRFRSTADEVIHEINLGAGATSPAEPVAVVVEKPAPWVLVQLPTLLEALSSVGLVVVLVIFMLVERRGLRDRLLRIAGHAHVAVTTRALDEAAQRISRYLIFQSVINASFGFAVGTALFAIGLPYALLCGFLAAVLRFIPYVGPIVGGTLPVALGLAVLPGWQGPLMILAVVIGVELICNLVLEPWFYGQSAGVSQVALLVAIAFWTWLWGPVGLVVATPLTVCLVVLARHVPDMEFLAVLLGDEPPLDLHQRLYQRLLAGDAEEACEVVHEFAQLRPEERLYDEMVIPALVRMQADRAQLRLSDGDESRVLESAAEVISNLARGARSRAQAKARSEVAGVAPPLRVPAYGADGEADEIAVAMLRNLVASPRAEIAPSWWSEAALEGEIDGVGEPPPIACIVTLSRGGIEPARRLAHEVRRRLPTTRVLVVAWRGLVAPGDDEGADGRATVTAVVGSLLEARDRVWQATGASELAAREPAAGGTGEARPASSASAA